MKVTYFDDPRLRQFEFAKVLPEVTRPFFRYTVRWGSVHQRLTMLLHMGKAHNLGVTTLNPWQCPLRGHAHMMMSNVYLSNRQI